MLLYSFDASTLSSLFPKLSSESNNACFSVDVDVFSPNRLENVKKIGFIARMDADGKFDFDVMDTLIQYRQTLAEVFIQVPFDFTMKAYDLLVLANSIDCNVILTPPASDAEQADWDQWRKLMLEYADAMLSFPAFGKELLPVTSYVQYMAMSVAGYQPETLTDDPIMKHFFEDGMNIPLMDALKEELHEKVVSAHGGDEGFESFVHGTLAGLYNRVDDRSHDLAATFVEWIEESPEEHIGYIMMQMLKALGITEKPFQDLMIDMAGDARRANVSIVTSLIGQLSPEGRANIPSLFLEDSELSKDDLDVFGDKVHAFLVNIVPA
ncbi:hypothetical protein [Pseudomonas putida]|uniref:Uncharacterized protein n=1 Tax=Pseudomonas putida TaxID=303 RepID=A0A8I1ECT3_PSEPU|nr:hypothetical protein [Pseudomonas putida]MBI6882992.1 hypothetical protein [Pseudomonas putida]